MKPGLINIILFLLLFLPPVCHGASVSTPDAGQIAMLTAKVLSTENYLRQPQNRSISLKFLRNYLDALDGQRLFFLQSDIQELERRYDDNLADEALDGNARPAFEIFDRFLERMKKATALARELLEEPVSFDTDETLPKSRGEAPWPLDEDELRQLWRQQVKRDLLQEALNGHDPTDARETILQRYNRRLRNARESDTESRLQIYLNALAHAYDPHSEYLPPSEVEQLDMGGKTSLQGIGVTLAMENGYARVCEIVPGGPADLDQHLRMGDRIVAIAREDEPFRDVVNMKLGQVAKLIRGSRNTCVRLSVIPADAFDPAIRAEITLRRGEIKLAEVQTGAEAIEFAGEGGRKFRLGRVVLPSFYMDLDDRVSSARGAAREMAQLIAALKAGKIEGLLLDLRGNQGGGLNEAIKITGLFIPSGPVAQLKDAQGQVQVMNDDDRAALYDGPLVVLVDRLSASASEILAAGLQDYGRAVIVGSSSTFGKGTLQKLVDLSRHSPSSKANVRKTGALKLTIQRFYRPDGGAIQHRGVIPDIVLPSPQDVTVATESSLKGALPYDEIAPAVFTPVNRVTAALDTLRSASGQRVDGNPEFEAIREEIARLKASQEAKSLSLNKAQRLKEIQAYFGGKESRQKNQFLRKPEPLKITEISLQPSGEPSGRTSLSETADPSNRLVLEEALRILADLVRLAP